jgi:hypothetical protein
LNEIALLPLGDGLEIETVMFCYSLVEIFDRCIVARTASKQVDRRLIRLLPHE